MIYAGHTARFDQRDLFSPNISGRDEVDFFFSKARSEPSPLSTKMRPIVAFSVAEADILCEVRSTTQGISRAAGDLRSENLVAAKLASPVKAHSQTFPVASK